MLTYFTTSIQRSKFPTSFSEPPDGPDDDPSGNKKAAVSQPNEAMFHEMLRFVELLCQRYPNESKTEFKRPLQWATTLRASTFGSAGGGFVVSNSKNSKTVVSSVANRSDNTQPLFALEQAGEGLFIAKVNTFEYLNKALQLSDQEKIREVQELLQANRNPLRNILGITVDSTNPGKSLIDAFDACIVSDSEPPASTQKREGIRTFRLALVLNSFDLRFFQATVQSLEKDRIISMEKVQDEVTMLQSFCGADEKCALSSVDWESDYTFANGYRAPPWRQVYGELCYIEIQPMDREKFIVTASKTGYFANKGYAVDGKGTDRLDYERVGNVYPTLVELLKAESPHFAEHIDHQDYLYRPDLISESMPAKDFLAGDGVGNRDGDDHDGPNSPEEARGEGVNGISGTSSRKAETTRGRHAANKEGGVENQIPTRRKAKPNAKHGGVGGLKHPHSGEPSLKWRALGLNPENGEAQGSAKAKARLPKKMGTGGSGDRSGRVGGGGGSSGKAAESAGKIRRGRRDEQEEDFSESESEESSEEDMQEKRPESSELPAEYWQIQKLVKYLRVGNQTATIIAICSLRDFDLRNETNQLAIRDVGGLDTLVNLLDTDDPKCKIGSLQILKEICQNVQIRSAIADLDGVQPLVDLLKDSNEELKCLAAETIAHCARNSKNRRAVRRYGGIRKLVRLLKTSADNQDERVAISGALALSSCSKSAKNKEAIQAAGSIPLLAKLLQSSNQKLLIPVVGILQECASDEHYRIAIRASGMIKFLVENLSSNNEELQTNCASAIFKCAEDDETRSLVQQYGGLAPLVNLLDNPANKELLVAATGAVWKCSQNLDNVAAFNSLNTIKKLVGLMENQPEEVLVNVVGALGACAQTVDGRQAIRESGGITPLVNLLTGTNQALLVNVTTAVGACALDGESMAIIDRLDGVRLLWSLLKSPNHHVQASAAWAICPCIEHAKDAGEMVRSFVGGLELIVSLLKSDSIDVLASVCAAIANIAKDEENLAVITDHGVVPMLAKLTTTRDDRLRKHLAESVACCCHWGNNKVAFGTAGAVAPLVKYLKSPEVAVHRSTARALHQLSMDPDNCITMHEHGVVKLLLGMVGSADEVLQEAAAGTIGNIRRLALASEKATMG